MSRKIIGVTVGTTLPKPNFKQTDPTKGDYIKNKPDFEGLKTQVNTISSLVGDTAVSEQISKAISEIEINSSDVLNDDGTLKESVLPEGYPYMSEGVVLPETSFEVGYEDEGSYGQGMILDKFILEKDCEYEVVWNGTTYNCIGTEIEADGFTVVALGNLEDVGGDYAEYPFGIMSFNDTLAAALGMYGSCGVYDGSTEAVVSINGSSIHKIDARFIPDLGVVTNIIDGDNAGSVRSTAASKNDDEYQIGAYATAFGLDTKASGVLSHAEGWSAEASGDCSHAEGENAKAIGNCSHAEGFNTTASGNYSHAEGHMTTASGDYSHVQGKNNIDDDTLAHIVGNGDVGNHSNAHTLDWNGNAWFAGNVYVGSTSGTNKDEGSKKLLVEDDLVGRIVTGKMLEDHYGNSILAQPGAEIFNNIELNIATGSYSHAEGSRTEATGDWSHAEGSNTYAIGNCSHAEGGVTAASGNYSHTEGHETVASGISSHAEGEHTYAFGNFSHTEGQNTVTYGDNSHVQGKYNIQDDTMAHIVGNGDSTSNSNAHTLDWDGNAWFAGDVYVGSTSGTNKDDGSKKLATADEVVIKPGKIVTGETLRDYENVEYVAQEGAEIFNNMNNVAAGINSHAEGNYTIASGDWSHAEGNHTKATGKCSHAEGEYAYATGLLSHAEGCATRANGNYSHAEGYFTDAIGLYSHAEGEHTIASGDCSHAQGKFNIEDTDKKYAHIVGNGDSTGHSNAHTLDWEGNAWFQGDVYVSSTSGTNKDEGSKKLATEDYVNEKIGNGIFVVNTYENHTDPIEYGADKTSEEIYQAWVEGQIIVCKYDLDGFTNIELQPVAFYPETAVFSNSVIIPGVDGVNQYFCLVINGSNVQRIALELATEDYVRNLVNTKSQVQFITWEADD